MAPAAQADRSSERGDAPNGPSTIVIIDDRLTNLSILKRLALTLEGEVVVKTFQNPKVALDFCRLHAPNLIITDYNMPEMNGADLIRLVRALPHGASTPIIVVSAYEDKHLRYEALAAGATDFLLSPVDHYEFRARSRNLLLMNRQQLLLNDRAARLESQIERDAERHRDALERSHALLLDVINAVPVIIGAEDRDGRTLFANRQAIAFRALGGEPANAATPPPRVPVGGVIAYEEEFRIAGEANRFLQTTRTSVLGDGEEEAMIVTVSVDVTARVMAARRESDARVLAEAGHRAKNEFLANMSHELRTPLNAIIGFADLMARAIFGPLGNERYADYSRDISSSAQHLLAIIDDILDLAKLEERKLQIDLEIFELTQVVDETLVLMTPEAARAGITLNADIESQLPTMYADRRRVKQCLVNTVSNAIKFSDKDSTVLLRASSTPSTIVIEVKDHGIGMSEDEIEIALSRFGQVERALTKSRKGTGLGLPLTREFVEIQGGTLEIVSQKGHGTTVRLIFPRRDAAASPGAG
jgi:signal transduction histidine kinase